jgi:adenine-specific DNA-methyltransferase
MKTLEKKNRELFAEVEKLKRRIKTLKSKKKYGLVWEEEKEPEQIILDCQYKIPILKEVTGKKIITNKKQPTNILIEGDNYHTLSVLNYTHKNKVDVIYIDPPYNTGKQDFRYNDKFVDENDSFRHSKWLSFIEKRLKLAKNLLKKDGIIFISIDENEYTQLKMLCDEIFKEQNKLSTHHIQVRYGTKNLNEKKDFQELVEYVLIYAKDKSFFETNKPSKEYDLNKFDLEIKELKKPDKRLELNGKKVDIYLNGSYSIAKKGKGNISLFKETWLSGSIYSGTGHGKTYQKIIENRVKIDGLSTLYKIHGLGEDGLGFRYMINPQREGSTRGKMFTKVPTQKKEEIKNGNSRVYKPIINYYDFSPDFGNIRHEGGMSFNSGKKPVKMLKQLINYHKNKNAKVLDFFAGSGSTAQATLSLNQEDKGTRQFMLCTNNEENICTKICYPRIKNVIKGYKLNKGLGGNLRYFKTELLDVEHVSHVSDEQKIKLTYKAGEMVALRENTFEEVEKNEWWQIFRNEIKYTAIYFKEDKSKLNKLIKKLGKLKETITLYIFSWGKNEYKNEFIEYKNIIINDIPEPIIDVYKEVNRLS